MKTVVYIDVLFCVNLIVDYVMLLSVKKLLSLQVRRKRLMLGAVIGGVGSFAALLPPMPAPVSMLISLGVCILMMSAALMPVSLRRLALASGVLFAVSFLYCGIMTAVLTLLSPSSMTVRNSVVYIGIHPLLLIALTMICYGILHIFYAFRGNSASISSHCRVKVRMGGRTITANGLIDTGNTLHEPFSGDCVVVMKQECCEEMKEMSDVLKTPSFEQDDLIRGIGVRMIPYSSVGGSGLLAAVRPSEMVISTENREFKVSAFLAFGDGSNFSEGCECLVPAELIWKGC